MNYKDKEKEILSIKVAELYYQLNNSQQQIASKLDISRPTVSRLLQYAKDKGYVQIKVTDPFMDLKRLEKELTSKYQLKDVNIAFSPTDDYSEIKHYISIKAAEYLNEIVIDEMTIGVSWGSTIYEVAKNLPESTLKGVEVVQLKGGISFSNVKSYAWESLSLFANAYQTLPKYLPLPLVFDNPIISEMVRHDRHIKSILETGKEAQVAIFTVGSVNDNDENINNRTISIDLEELSKKEFSILVAGGAKKSTAIHTVLSAGYANALITDQHTAKKLLNI
jgi:deoxyribonucleoside regulator